MNSCLAIVLVSLLGIQFDAGCGESTPGYPVGEPRPDASLAEQDRDPENTRSGSGKLPTAPHDSGGAPSVDAGTGGPSPRWIAAFAREVRRAIRDHCSASPSNASVALIHYRVLFGPSADHPALQILTGPDRAHLKPNRCVEERLVAASRSNGWSMGGARGEELRGLVHIVPSEDLDAP